MIMKEFTNKKELKNFLANFNHKFDLHIFNEQPKYVVISFDGFEVKKDD